MSVLVVDASVVAHSFLRSEPHWRAARRIIASEHALIAPAWLAAEVASAIWKTARTGAIEDIEVATQFVRLLPRLIALADVLPLVPRALHIAMQLDHPVYDALYLALAQQSDSRVVTFDNRLLRKTRNTAYTSLIENASAFKG